MILFIKKKSPEFTLSRKFHTNASSEHLLVLKESEYPCIHIKVLSSNICIASVQMSNYKLS